MGELFSTFEALKKIFNRVSNEENLEVSIEKYQLQKNIDMKDIEEINKED